MQRRTEITTCLVICETSGRGGKGGAERGNATWMGGCCCLCALSYSTGCARSQTSDIFLAGSNRASTHNTLASFVRSRNRGAPDGTRGLGRGGGHSSGRRRRRGLSVTLSGRGAAAGGGRAHVHQASACCTHRAHDPSLRHTHTQSKAKARAGCSVRSRGDTTCTMHPWLHPSWLQARGAPQHKRTGMRTWQKPFGKLPHHGMHMNNPHSYGTANSTPPDRPHARMTALKGCLLCRHTPCSTYAAMRATSATARHAAGWSTRTHNTIFTGARHPTPHGSPQ